MHRKLFIILTTILVAGCTKPRDDIPWCADETDTQLPEISRALTWYADVGPIVEARCARCHSGGNIGPFPLETYEEVFNAREAVRAAVVNRTMPPWLPERCCNEFRASPTTCATGRRRFS